MCWVSVLRPIAVMPKSQCSTSPRWITGLSPSLASSTPMRWISTEGWNHVPSPMSLTRWRIHHTTSSLVVTPGVMTRFENAAEITSWTIAWRRR